MSEAEPKPAIDVSRAFTPFDAGEAKKLWQYWDRARQIGECSFVKEKITLTMGGSSEERSAHAEVTHAGEDALARMLMLMRPFYAKKDAKFHKTMRMLRDHVRDTHDGREAMETLEDYGRGHRDVLKGNTIEVQGVRAGDLLDAYLREGFHIEDPDPRLHSDWDLSNSLVEFLIIDTALKLAGLYVQFSSFANSILHTASLVPAETHQK